MTTHVVAVTSSVCIATRFLPSMFSYVQITKVNMLQVLVCFERIPLSPVLSPIETLLVT